MIQSVLDSLGGEWD